MSGRRRGSSLPPGFGGDLKRALASSGAALTRPCGFWHWVRTLRIPKRQRRQQALRSCSPPRWAAAAALGAQPAAPANHATRAWSAAHGHRGHAVGSRPVCSCCLGSAARTPRLAAQRASAGLAACCAWAGSFERRLGTGAFPRGRLRALLRGASRAPDHDFPAHHSGAVFLCMRLAEPGDMAVRRTSGQPGFAS